MSWVQERNLRSCSSTGFPSGQTERGFRDVTWTGHQMQPRREVLAKRRNSRLDGNLKPYSDKSRAGHGALRPPAVPESGGLPCFPCSPHEHFLLTPVGP